MILELVQTKACYLFSGTFRFNSRVFEGQSFKTQQMETSFARLEWSKLECEYDTLYAMHLAKHESGLPLKKNLRVIYDTTTCVFL
jgi:hypothetical protein